MNLLTAVSRALTGIRCTSLLLSALVIAPVLMMLGALAPWCWQKAFSACVAPSHPCYALLIVSVVFGVIWASSSVMAESAPPLGEDAGASQKPAFSMLALLRTGFAMLLVGMLIWYVSLSVSGRSTTELEPGVIVLGPLLVLLVVRVIKLVAIHG